MDKYVTKRRHDSSDNNDDSSTNPTPSTSSSTSISSSTLHTIPEKKPKIYPFSEKWLEIKEFKDWLTTDIKQGNTIAKCKYCQINLHNHKPHLQRHLNTEKHKSLMSSIRSTAPIKNILQPSDEDQMVKRAEIKLAAFLATNNLPFLLADTLIPLIANICPDSKIAQKMAMGRTKATAVVNQVLGAHYMDEKKNCLKEPGNFFSVIMDETTDQGTIKQCAITATYIDHENNVKTDFLDMVEMPSGKAEDLFLTLTNNLKEKDIPIKNLVGFSADTCNTMVGEHNSVFSKLKEQLPEIACIKCSCHMIHLAASKACLKLPRSIEDLLRNVGAHFGRSYCRQQKLFEMQTFFKEEIHKILSPATTRWLSLKPCVDRVLEQYVALEAYFRVECFEDPSRTTESIHATLRNSFTKLYLEFMSYVLGLLTDFNVLFQSEKPLLHKLKPETEKLIKTLATNYMNFQHCKDTSALNIDHNNPRLYLELDKIYIGMQAQETLHEMKSQPNPPHESEIDRALLDCMQFYIEAISQIKSRFDFSDTLFNVISIIDPTNMTNFDPQQLSSILKRFPVLKTYVDLDSLTKQWREYCLLDLNSLGIERSLDASNFWKAVFKLTDLAGKPKFEALRKVIQLLLVIPFSNASVERVFSKLKRIKTEARTRLNTSTIVSLMATSVGVANAGGLKKFEPTKSMLNKKIKYA